MSQVCVKILSMKSHLLIILFLLFGITCFVIPNDAAMNDGSQGPEPLGWRSGEESIIQMKSEHLDIHFGVETTKVKVAFTFISHKKSGPALQKLGFPDASRSYQEGDVSGPIKNLITRVNGKEVKSELVEGHYHYKINEDGSEEYEKVEEGADESERHAWYVIDVEFPVGEEVIVEREYSCPSGGSTNWDSFFIYETRTGGAWKGKIEKLTADVTFDKTVRPDLVMLEPEEGWEWSDDKSKVSLTWGPFEPRTEENRQWISITTLNIPLLEQIHEDAPDLVPTVEGYVENWKKNVLNN
ncbi:MAG: hypothetical protein CMO55_01185 [Verrucomicrobiales bacterium]|nr:hypothetical protein [Verrucomicrobiales bacterium]